MIKNLEPVLKNSPLFKSIYENAATNTIALMDEEGYIIDVNEAFTHSFGYTKDDLHGKHGRVLFSEDDQKNQIPEIEIETVKQQGSAGDKNYMMRKDGSCVWVSGESVFAKDNKGKIFIIKVIQNIHEQKVLEKFLKESQVFLESVVKSIADALVVIDTNYRILKVNNAFYSLFHINSQTIEGLQLFELYHCFFNSGELKEQVENMIEKEAASQFELKWHDEGDTVKYLSIEASFIQDELSNPKIILVIQDITDKVQSEQQKDDLIGFVVHELRAPLSNVMAINSLLEQTIEDDNKENAEELLKKSNESTKQLSSMVQELYDATKAGAGNLQFDKSSFNFEDVVQEVIESVQLIHADYTITKEGNADVEVSADRGRISQVLNNYLSNAIKYSPGKNKADVRIKVEKENVVVSVTDYGEGIAEDKIPHIFKRYYRADNTKKIEGLGLGLFLSKQIIDAHNGRVWVKSKLKEGSTFNFSIPV